MSVVLISVAAMDAQSPPARHLIRSALHDLRARNGQHAFEDLCRDYARRTITPYILPATGPVGAGGDQGRDFETFRSYVAEAELEAFPRVRAGCVIAFACTLQADGLKRKIQSDIRKIISGEPVDGICVFTEADVSTALRHELQAWTSAEHQVWLEIHDGNGLAENLAYRALYPIAEGNLGLPSWSVLHPEDLQHPARAWLSGGSPAGSSLPRNPRPVIGRCADIDQAKGWLLAGRSKDEGTRPVVVVTGAPGAGKTTLAISVVRAVASSFPDGQHWIQATDAGPGDEATGLLSALLTALEGDPALVPAGRQAQLLRLRTVLAGRRALIALDDLGSEQLLRELTSISGPFALVVTSRSRMTGLASDGVRFIDVGPLPEDDATRLAASIAERLTEQESRELAAACGGLPIAVSIAAAHIARRPQLEVRRFLDQITSPDDGLDELSAGQKSVEAVIEQSYRLLSADQARVMQALGTLPNTAQPADVIAAALAEDIAGLTPASKRRTRRILDSLFELNLVEEPESGRYRLHGILYRFARRRAAAASPQWRDQVLGHACLMYRIRIEDAVYSIGYADASARVPLESNASAIQSPEHDRTGAVLLVTAACAAELWDHAISLVRAITPALEHLCRWEDIRQVYQNVREAGERTGNSDWIATALLNLGTAAAREGQGDQALGLYQQCREVANAAGDLFMANAAYTSYGDLMLGIGHVDEAIPALRHALKAWRLLDNDFMLVHTLHSMGMACVDKARLARAEAYFRNALRVAARNSIAVLLPIQGIALATVLRLKGRIDEAREECHIALERARGVGDRHSEAVALRETAILKDYPGDGDSPGGLLTAALEIYRELGDVRGQVDTLAELGATAEDDGHPEQAVRHFTDCLNLAVQAGDAGQIARSMAHLAVLHATIGQIPEAQELIEQAEEIAVQTGNSRLLAQVHDRRAYVLRLTGHASLSVPLLQRSVRMLNAAGASADLSWARVQLGWALMCDGRWLEAFNELQRVAEAPRDAANAHVRASAHRSLAVLYSRRQLSDEALDAAAQALALAREAGSASEEMHCILATANVFARIGQWPEAAAEYQRAEAMATDLRDIRTLVAVHANQASCWLAAGDTDKSLRVLSSKIDIAKRLGMADVEAAMRLNRGTSLASQGNLADAVGDFGKARAIAADLANHDIRATASLNLARAYRDQGTPDRARASAREAREIFAKVANWNDAARALVLEMQAASPDDDGAPGTATATSAIQAAGNPKTRDTGGAPQKASTGLTIHISDTVTGALRGIDVKNIYARIAKERRHCFACRLPIAETGQAELLLLRSDHADSIMVTLAHSACMQSSIVQLPSPPQEATMVRLDTECLILDADMPAIAVDCRSPQAIGEGGNVTDPFLDLLRGIGFMDVRNVITSGYPTQFTLDSTSSLKAWLAGNKLTISSGGQTVMPGAELSFLPKWYRATCGGALVAMFGRNLRGMVSDDPRYLIEAAESGNLVIAALRLDVSPPGRNERCICTPRTNLKFKRCCGKP